MRFLLRHLSVSYLRQHRAKTLLTLVGVIVGVATAGSIRSARTTLLEGLRTTVDRIAGKAQLQIAADGGVPEELLERLWELDGIRAYAPVIEQVVVASAGTGSRTPIGSLLVLGIDLLGDKEMREYGFEGEDADLDDPLLFLAQPDSVAVSRDLARRAGLAVGDELVWRTLRGERRLRVRGLLTPRAFSEAYGGNIAVMDVYAAQLAFDRGRRFDRIEVRLEDGIGLDRGTEILRRAVGSGYRVETPARRSAQLEGIVRNFAAGFDFTSLFALGIGTFLIFNAFNVAVNRRRRDIGTLRALGATPRQVQTLFLLEAAVIGLVGGGLGLGLGALMTDAALAAMSQAVATIYGFGDAARARLEMPVAIGSLALGLAASLVGAWGPARAAARVRPIDAFAAGRHQARVAPASWLRLAIGAAALASAIVVAIAWPVMGLAVLLANLMLAAFGAALLVSPLARVLFELAMPRLTRLWPATGMLAADSLRANPRRTATTVVAMTLALGFVLGTSSYIHSTRTTLVRWMGDMLTADLYVRASAKLVHPDFRFPAALGDEIRALPGVRAVESFRAHWVPLGDKEIQVATIEFAGLLARTRHRYLEGDDEAMRRGLVGGRAAAISDNLHRLRGLGVGDAVELDTPAGRVRIPVAAVIEDLSSDKGTIYLDRAFALELWPDDRVDVFDVSLAPGADRSRLALAIRERLGDRYPALITTREEFVAEITRALDDFYVLMRLTLVLSLVVAFLGITSSLLIAVTERTREIGILKALGAVGRQIRASIVVEALAVAAVALVLAVPLGWLHALYLEKNVAESFAGWRMPHDTSFGMLVQVLVTLPVVSAFAAWLPARLAGAVPITEAIEYE